jgi:hypothetical protein
LHGSPVQGWSAISCTPSSAARGGVLAGVDQRDRREQIEDRGAIGHACLAQADHDRATLQLGLDRERVAGEVVGDEAVGDQAAAAEDDRKPCDRSSHHGSS